MGVSLRPDSLVGHYIHTRGQIREGFCNTDPRLNSGPSEAVSVIADSRRPYTSIDIETTGIDYEYCQVLEFGAVVDDWVTPIEKLPRFHAYLIHNRIEGEPFALSMHPVILKRIANRDKPECANFTFLEPEQLAGLFELWAGAWGAFGSGGSGKSLIPAGKNFQGFDRPFLKRVPRFGGSTCSTGASTRRCSTGTLRPIKSRQARRSATSGRGCRLKSLTQPSRMPSASLG